MEWCGLPECGFASLVLAYQGSIIGIAGIVAAYFTIRATRLAADHQVRGLAASTQEQIDAMREIAEAERRDAADERALKARALTFTILPALLLIQKKAEAMLEFVEHVKRQGLETVSRDNETVTKLTIDISFALHRIANDLYILGPDGGGGVLQLMSLCDTINDAMNSSNTETLKPALHEPQARGVIQRRGDSRRAHSHPRRQGLTSLRLLRIEQVEQPAHPQLTRDPAAAHVSALTMIERQPWQSGST